MAQDGKELVFVEVRTRHSGGFGTPEESLSAAKVRRLVTTCSTGGWKTPSGALTSFAFIWTGTARDPTSTTSATPSNYRSG